MDDEPAENPPLLKLMRFMHTSAPPVAGVPQIEVKNTASHPFGKAVGNATATDPVPFVAAVPNWKKKLVAVELQFGS